jgi:hypothetical protein
VNVTDPVDETPDDSKLNNPKILRRKRQKVIVHECLIVVCGGMLVLPDHLHHSLLKFLYLYIIYKLCNIFIFLLQELRKMVQEQVSPFFQQA